MPNQVCHEDCRIAHCPTPTLWQGHNTRCPHFGDFIIQGLPRTYSRTFLWPIYNNYAHSEWHFSIPLVKQGFSINKEMVVENQFVKSVVAQGIIKDHNLVVSGVGHVAVSRSVIVSMSGARATSISSRTTDPEWILNDAPWLAGTILFHKYYANDAATNTYFILLQRLFYFILILRMTALVTPLDISDHRYSTW